jgi:hypothetical protein
MQGIKFGRTTRVRGQDLESFISNHRKEVQDNKANLTPLPQCMCIISSTLTILTMRINRRGSFLYPFFGRKAISFPLKNHDSVPILTLPHSTTGSFPNSNQSEVITAVVELIPTNAGRAASCTHGIASKTKTKRTFKLSA